MVGIPAASLHGVDLDQLCREFPAQGKEIMRLAQLMNRGEETDEEFQELCQLLNNVGYTAKSEGLLRANAKEGDSNHALYLQLHGRSAEDGFTNAMHRFEQQFGVELTQLRSPRYLNKVYSLKPLNIPSDVGKKLFSLLSSGSEVEAIYHGQNEILADVYGTPSDESHAVEAQPLIYQNGEWKVQDV